MRKAALREVARNFETTEKRNPPTPPRPVRRESKSLDDKHGRKNRQKKYRGIIGQIVQLPNFCSLRPVIAPASAPSDSAGITKVWRRLKEDLVTIPAFQVGVIRKSSLGTTTDRTQREGKTEKKPIARGQVVIFRGRVGWLVGSRSRVRDGK